MRFYSKVFGGFHTIWIKWILECITSVSFSLLINEEPTGLIKPSRGIPHGDPLSPYIFILCMEFLTNNLITESLQTKIGVGIKLSKNTERVPSLLFADDCLLFCKADVESCRRIKHILDDFCNSSGQLINYHKSTLTFSKKANSSHRRVVAGIFSITHTDSLGKYLGCPVFQKKPNRVVFEEIIEKTMSKLSGWKANCPSKVGRIVLIQSHIESLPAHTMQCFTLPNVITAQIDRLSREFLWKENNTEKGLPLVAWNRICRPKDKGGIGLRKAAAINVAFKCKLAWKILTNNESM